MIEPRQLFSHRACRMLSLALASLASVTTPGTAAQSPTLNKPSAHILRIDATDPFVMPGPSDFRTGSNRAPDGGTIGVTERYLTMNGKPWSPVMGELHYSRIPAEEWEEEILKMKAAGVDIISTYVIWIHHEEVQGEWNWSGQRDLRRFAALCARHHMMLFARIGPWSHGEARNGGLPDWVVKTGSTRQLDPRFMARTGTFYQQIAQQLRGMMWKDGGPVVGIQLENEYVQKGPGRGDEYIMALKKMALAYGMDVPLYTVTGWGNAAAPHGEVLPVYGGYPDAPWSDSRTKLPPSEVYAFRFNSRESGNMGLVNAEGSQQAGQFMGPAKTPFLTAEVGGGMQSTYHRRVTVNADDIAAMMPVLLGSGVNGYGTYMFHGGENPDGKLTTLQESQATGYPTDLPVKSYDFEAPIGEFGLERPSLRAIKEWNYFLNDFGSLLAPMPPFRPAAIPPGPEDLSVVRWSVRTDGRAGFLFLNNYVREALMPLRSRLQFSIALPGGLVRTIPDEPIDIPTGAYFAWPFGLNLDGLPLRYATAQLVMKVGTTKDGSDETLVFACIHNVRCELALEGIGLQVTTHSGVQTTRRNGLTILTELSTGNAIDPLQSSAQIKTPAGKTVSVLLLTPERAMNAWKVSIHGVEHLVETPADVFADDNSLTLQQLNQPLFSFTVFPRPAQALQATRRLTVDRAGYSASVATQNHAIEVKALQPAGIAPPIHPGPTISWRKIGVPQLPDDAVWNSAAATWSIKMNSLNFTPAMSNVFLKINYVGDGARLKTGGRLLTDDFFRDEPWVVGLRRYTAKGVLPSLGLEILPIRGDSPVYLPSPGRLKLNPSRQTVKLTSVEVLPQYQLKIRTK